MDVGFIYDEWLHDILADDNYYLYCYSYDCIHLYEYRLIYE